MLRQKFDLVISIGEDCACAMYLRKCLLRDASYPFDWLCQAPFEKRVDLLLNDFDGFLIKENMHELFKSITELGDTENKSYEDINTSFRFYHDFKKTLPLDISFPQVKEKYNRRIKRLYNNVANYQKVLFVWWSRDKKLDTNVLLTAQKQLSERFKKNIYLLVFENDATLQTPKEEKLSDFVIKYTIDLLSGLKTTIGNEKNSLAIFQKIKKTTLIKKQLKIFMINRAIRLGTMFIFPKKRRRNIRSKLKERFLP